MNDFTKDELDTLRRALKYYLPQHNGESDLKSKIQSMIDSYCEHTWTDGSGNQIFCAKCHQSIGKR